MTSGRAYQSSRAEELSRRHAEDVRLIALGRQAEKLIAAANAERDAATLRADVAEAELQLVLARASPPKT